jgi:hypothetical protein
MGMVYYEHVPEGQDECDKRGSHLAFELETLWEISKRTDGSLNANANMSRHALGGCSFE